jgi:hypothetical protein
MHALEPSSTIAKAGAVSGALLLLLLAFPAASRAAAAKPDSAALESLIGPSSSRFT